MKLLFFGNRTDRITKNSLGVYKLNHKIRQVTPEDLIPVCQVENACFPPAEAATEAAFATRIALFPQRFLVAEADGKIVGLINGCCTDKPQLDDELYEPNCPHSLENPWQTVFGLAVLPEYQGQGIAKALMKGLCDIAETGGQVGMILTCKKEKIGMYEHFGYHCRGLSRSSHGGAEWYDMIMEF